MRVKCPYCAKNIPAEDVNIQQALAKCTGCNAVFALDGGKSEAPAPAPRGPLELPGNFNLEYGPGGVTLRYSWKSATAWSMLFFVVFWDGFLIFWYVIAVSQGAPLPAILFPLIHVAVGVALTYWTAASFVNRTEITFGGERVRVAHGPLWWPGEREVSTQQITQFFIEVSGMQVNNRDTYNVSLLLTGGKRISLVKYLPHPELALYIEQEAEKALGIEDRRVVGEVTG